jgi:hypothetical protein
VALGILVVTRASNTVTAAAAQETKREKDAVINLFVASMKEKISIWTALGQRTA